MGINGTGGEKYITGVARSLIGKLKIRPSEIRADYGEKGYEVGPFILWARRSKEVRGQLERMTASTLGRIAAKGFDTNAFKQRKTSIHSLTPRSFTDEIGSGRQILQELAAKAIIAEMYDILLRRHYEELAPAQQEHLLQFHPFAIG